MKWPSRKQLVQVFRLTWREYYADFLITPPLTLFALGASLRLNGLNSYWLGLLALGFIAWTLYEYLVHRFISHEVCMFREAHAMHHRHQKDYIGVPPIFTLAFYLVFWGAVGFKPSSFMVGFSLGYVWYSALHTMLHYLHIAPGHVLYGAKYRHARHHRYHDCNFGVTWCLWDSIFQTEWKKGKK